MSKAAVIKHAADIARDIGVSIAKDGHESAELWASAYPGWKTCTDALGFAEAYRIADESFGLALLQVTRDEEYRQRVSKSFIAHRESIADVADILEKRGIRICVSGCGCCGSPLIKIEIDGKTVVDSEEDSFDMLGTEGLNHG